MSFPARSKVFSRNAKDKVTMLKKLREDVEKLPERVVCPQCKRQHLIIEVREGICVMKECVACGHKF